MRLSDMQLTGFDCTFKIFWLKDSNNIIYSLLVLKKLLNNYATSPFLYINIKTFVKVECMKLESFDIKVGVYQISVLNPLVCGGD